MIKLLLLLFLTLSLYANSKQDMLSLYKDSKFKESCDIGYEEGYKNKYDEEFMTIYASACLKSDYINRLSMPVSILRKTKESRANAAYFSIILMQKKQIHSYLFKVELKDSIKGLIKNILRVLVNTILHLFLFYFYLESEI